MAKNQAPGRAISSIMLAILIISMVIVTFNIQAVRASETIIDTDGSAYFSKYPSGPYWYHRTDSGAYNGNFWYTYCSSPGVPEYLGVWTASLSGQYEVFVFVPNPVSFSTYNPTHSAKYAVTYQGGGYAERIVNQALRLGGWLSIGSFMFDGTAGVILNDDTGEPYASKMVAFDAIKFTEIVPPRTLTVSSAHDSPNPSNGAHSYSNGQSVTCSVTSPVTESGTVWVCSGWSGTGSVPSSGSSTSVTFTITQDSTITWNWGVGATDLGIVPLTQHKDTQMLCLDGCNLQGDHAWNVDHVTGAGACTHDSVYCARASLSMIASYYGGHLSQDRISFESYGSGDPEDDLGHRVGIWPHMIGRSGVPIIDWALNLASGTVPRVVGKPTFAQVKNWINNARPLLTIIPIPGATHAVVIDGYDDPDNTPNTADDSIHVIDPMTGTESAFAFLSYSFDSYYVPPAGATARNDETTLTQDSDGDGVIDFDEINRFYTNPNNPDSDGDLVFDKQEIMSYTFLSDGSWDLTDSRRPNADNDWARAEWDRDSDNGGTTDGLEDLNRNGRVDSGETDPLNPSDDPLRAASVRVSAHSPVNLLVTDPVNRRVGYDPVTHSVVNEIPYATYSGPSSEPQEIMIPNSINGTYEVDAIGIDTGPYTICVESLDSNSSVIDRDTWEGVAIPDEQYNETVSLDPDGSFVLAHDLEVSDITPLKTTVGESYSVPLSLIVENSGNCTETADVTVYVNETVVASFTGIVLTSKNSAYLSCGWDTTGIVKGNYSIRAVVDAVLGEIDTTDNTLIRGWVFITIPGDINGDQYVNAKDAVILGSAFGATRGDPTYSSNADVNGDDWCNAKDAVILGAYFGQHW